MNQSTAEVRQHIAFLLEMCAQRSGEVLAKRLEEFGLIAPCYYMLLIASQTQVTQKQISEFLNINVNTVTRYMDELEKLGYARRVMNPDNRKENLIQITDNGEKITGGPK